MARSRRAGREETAMEMTPMIDVTFLLLVFFLCTIRFKTQEGMLAAFLPEEGPAPAPAVDHLERLDLAVDRVAAVDTDPHRNKAWVWRADQVRVRVGGGTVPLSRLADTLSRARERDPELRVTLRPGRGSLYVDSVKVLNECLRAGVTAIAFAGTPADG